MQICLRYPSDCAILHYVDDDDLIGTADVATRLGVRVATINRWAADDTHPLRPAVVIDGPKRIAARLYRIADVDAYHDARIADALARGACPRCTTFAAQHFHDPANCPAAMAS